jgi:type II secretion system protein L
VVKKSIFIFLSENSENVEWLSHQDNVFSKPSKGLGIEAKEAMKGAFVIVVLPAPEFSFFNVKIPTRNKNTLTKAIPFALEEETISTLDDTFFAVEPDNNAQHDGTRGVWLISQERLQKHLSFLDKMDIEPDYIVPESALVKNSTSDCSLWMQAEHAILQFNGAITPLNKHMLPLMLKQLNQQTKKAICCDVVNFTEDDADTYLGRETLNNLSLNQQRYPPTTYLEKLAIQFSKLSTVNLLQGKHNPKIKISEIITRWKTPSVIAISSLVFLLFTKAFENWHLSNQINQLDNSINQQYISAFPDAKSLSIAKSKAQQAIKDIENKKNVTVQNKFTQMLSSIGHIILAMPGVSLKKIDYKQAVLKISVESKNIASFDTLFESISALNYESKVLSTSNHSGTIVGTIEITQ